MASGAVGEGKNGRNKGEDSSQHKNPCSSHPGGSIGLYSVELHPGSTAKIYHAEVLLLNASRMRIRFPPSAMPTARGGWRSSCW